MAKPFAKAFYSSKAWLDCREAYVVSVFGLCKRCELPGYIVHHKIKLTPSNINNPDISLNHEHLEYLCLDCHNKEHGKSDIDLRYTFDSEGQVIPIAPLKNVQ